jgi:excisionase family DNA binding protein
MERSLQSPNSALRKAPTENPKRHKQAVPLTTLEQFHSHGKPTQMPPNPIPGSERISEGTLAGRLSRMEGLLNSKQVIGMLGVHITTLQLWTRRGDIPFLRVGHSVRFDPAQLADWLGKRQIGV